MLVAGKRIIKCFFVRAATFHGITSCVTHLYVPFIGQRGCGSVILFFL